MLDDATAKARYRFTITELRELAKKLKLPEDGVTTPSGDRVDHVEALAMLCRRLSEPSKLLTVASEFGRGTGPYSRVVKKTAQLLVNQHRGLVYFNYQLVHLRINDTWLDQVHERTLPLNMKICNVLFSMGIHVGTVSIGKAFKPQTG
ncbi:hypothetical protein PPTG_15622 [Phytophthora nicotianae INRA-310]|uniref:Uncharacterized protein n=1 Tax=Phytophthora nicotianae (strain INRA-310) TaxID=761204 RepID=W2PSM2_PHYN3|nr:hypothetical protein PPTG_15622 [Phytophthora nicotianae INRA-310]ETN03646.1 hypothetical protein PPTG_15622 [Phytophthora nicotianae INRA-310]